MSGRLHIQPGGAMYVPPNSSPEVPNQILEVRKIEQLGRYGSEYWMGCLNDRYLVIVSASRIHEEEFCQVCIKDQGIQHLAVGVFVPHRGSAEAELDRIVDQVLDEKIPDEIHRVIHDYNLSAEQGHSTWPNH